MGGALYDTYNIPKVVLLGIYWFIYNQSSNYKEKNMETIKQCPCEKCVLLAICKPKVLSSIDEDEAEDLKRTTRNLVNKFVFDLVRWSTKQYECKLLYDFLEIRTDMNDRGKTTYAIKIPKIIEFGEAMGFDMSDYRKE